MKQRLTHLLVSTCAVLLCATGCRVVPGVAQKGGGAPQRTIVRADAPRASSGSPFLDRLAEAALERTTHEVRYDPKYVVLDYPGGDVPADTGVCTDEVIRAYRAVGVDLQREVHEDMTGAFAAYPRTWGLARPDANIDHRRVPNLMVFFERQGAGLPVTAQARDYRPGDVVTWDLGGGMTHIGLVTSVPTEADPARLMLVHNIGAGPQLEDVLFSWKITGHYRYEGPRR